jgi:translation elongation factor EF-4
MAQIFYQFYHDLAFVLGYQPSLLNRPLKLCQRKRGQFINMDYLDDIRVNIVYELPLAEVVFDLHILWY